MYKKNHPNLRERSTSGVRVEIVEGEEMIGEQIEAVVQLLGTFLLEEWEGSNPNEEKALDFLATKE